MAVRVCSLILTETQNVPAGDQYHVVRFPFGAAESSDEHHMHEKQEPGGKLVV